MDHSSIGLSSNVGVLWNSRHDEAGHGGVRGQEYFPALLSAGSHPAPPQPQTHSPPALLSFTQTPQVADVL